MYERGQTIPLSLAEPLLESVRELDCFRMSVDFGENGTDEDAAWGMLVDLRDRFAKTKFPIGVDRIEQLAKDAERKGQGTDVDDLWRVIEELRGDYADALASIDFEVPPYDPAQVGTPGPR